MVPTAAYAACQRIVRQAGTNFYLGMRLLPDHKRMAMYAVYAWSRLCDDAVDEYRGPEAEIKLREAESLLERAMDDGWARDGHPVVVALGDAIRRFRLSPEPFWGLLEGMRIDLDRVRFQTVPELVQYCRKVAGTIGQLCVEIFGYTDQRARAIAIDMGVALQMTNILRDLREDVRRDRIYLPREDFEAAGYSVEDLAAGRVTPAFHRLLALEVARTRAYYQRAAQLFPLIQRDARLCAQVLYAVYYELLARIESSGFDVLRQRVRVPTRRKLQLMGALLWRRESG
ncbi:MAG: phytoene/squalene synthase family protein [Firmicutes bacterium]|nr:phytoene/squalene synthase family protein [Alicyclobacillaceae bacterium]MCL6498070.1 phytoene/squalene synthase family protein [Bacillota bacterium]